MKIFALYIKIQLDKNSEWLSEFRKKYDEPGDLHITLIQPRYIDENKVRILGSDPAQGPISVS